MSSNSSKDEDMTIAFLAKMGQSGFDKIDLTEIDGFELITNETLSSWICRKFLYRTNNSYTDISMILKQTPHP